MYKRQELIEPFDCSSASSSDEDEGFTEIAASSGFFIISLLSVCSSSIIEFISSTFFSMALGSKEELSLLEDVSNKLFNSGSSLKSI